MKRKNIMKGLAAVAMTFAVTSCSSDYLDLQPISNESSESIPDNIYKMRTASYGTMQSMYRQYSLFYDLMFFNGEPWYQTYFGEGMGQDMTDYFMQRYVGSTFVNWQHMTSGGTWGAQIAWIYPYGIISQANYIIAGEKNLEEKGELEDEMAFRMAQAYTMRAHGYIRLHQMFGPRWEDSNNGQVHSVVIRTEAPDATKPVDKAVSSTNEVLDLIYSDLDRAIELYELSEFNRDYVWETDLSVAYGLYARAALLKNDWQNAEKYAHLASEGYEVMAPSEYISGFNTANGEWMWGSSDSPVGVYFASYGASFACNGAYTCIYKSGAGAIDYTLYKQVNNANDVRCQLYYTPDKEPRSIRAAFWNTDDISASTMDLNRGDRMPALLNAYCEKMYDLIGKNAGWIFPYTDDYFAHTVEIGSTYVPFGAQFKFWGKDNYSSSAVPFMRASEMLFIEAEAAYHNGNTSVAQDCLAKVNMNRITNYQKTTKTGEDLLAEIKLYRRFELWGEGFSWFDFKRWNEPIVRVGWKMNDSSSGNWPSATAKTFEVTDMNNWVWPISDTEIDYNDLVPASINNISPASEKAKNMYYKFK
ncbi:MAG: RagB/SusD family nutrient uptake outer membrane protein [Bacteroidales bacterium]|nr:RagB/SusD family nutrient uptake outer membrane protein [Bacteroidales bacterium]